MSLHSATSVEGWACSRCGASKLGFMRTGVWTTSYVLCTCRQCCQIDRRIQLNRYLSESDRSQSVFADSKERTVTRSLPAFSTTVLEVSLVFPKTVDQKRVAVCDAFVELCIDHREASSPHAQKPTLAVISWQKLGVLIIPLHLLATKITSPIEMQHQNKIFWLAVSGSQSRKKLVVLMVYGCDVVHRA